jgi:sodium/proline symporter
MIVASFAAFLVLFVAIGLASAYLSRGGSRDYLLASQSVKPWLVGLSAVATNNSGYMFIGVIGFTYLSGLSAFWLMFGWIVGDWLASTFIHRRLRDASARASGATFASALAEWHGGDLRRLRRLIGLVSVVFLSIYAAAQLKAGSKALHVLFGWPEYVGAVLGSGIVMAYCMAGGIRASIWTDAAQSLVMVVAMGILLVVCVQAVGGVAQVHGALAAVGPGYLDWFPEGLPFGVPWGPLLFTIGWLFAGFSVVGQPHIMVRFMALDASDQMSRARAWYYGWFTVFYAMATGVGLMSRLLLPETAAFDAELALPTIALDLLPELLVGVILAGIFAATMSTADSLILSCAGSVTEDLPKSPGRSIRAAKLATVAVTLTALGVALLDSSSVFALVIYAWAGLGAAFGPLLAGYALGFRLDERLALAMVATGVSLVFVWKQVDWLAPFYEGMIAIGAGLMLLVVGRALGLAQRATPAAGPEPVAVRWTGARGSR